MINLNEKGPTVDFSEINGKQFFDVVFIRKNIGYDLAAYRDGLKFLQDETRLQIKQIYFMNNGIVWFPEMVESYFKNIQGLEADIVAASVSNQYVGHIQTFFWEQHRHWSFSDSGLPLFCEELEVKKNCCRKRRVEYKQYFKFELKNCYFSG